MSSCKIAARRCMISETASFAASGAAPASVADSMQLCRQLVQQLFALSLCAVMPFCFCFAFAFVLFVTGLSRLAATHHWLLFMQGGVWRLRCARLLVLLACQEVMVEESAQEVSPQRAIPDVSGHGEDHADAANHSPKQRKLHSASAWCCSHVLHAVC